MLFASQKSATKPNCVSVGYIVCVSYGKSW
ncbi:hypothetical protein BACCIP111895_00845 [Neobacillus rhizosphaerae]|uniref:Uncharacterized protein n=1 Tax=Neobacillus rhizosphaerae TaxID=2880965 RepID=A0ABN8KN77_9BACI|nr:hypothetical protein BACCIP111895_00845 [Neobacillus rhizosphaerae]